MVCLQNIAARQQVDAANAEAAALRQRLSSRACNGALEGHAADRDKLADTLAAELRQLDSRLDRARRRSASGGGAHNAAAMHVRSSNSSSDGQSAATPRQADVEKDAELDQLRRQLETLQREVATGVRAASGSAALRDAERCAELEAQSAQLSTQLRTAEQTREELAGKVSNLEEELAELRDERDALAAAISPESSDHSKHNLLLAGVQGSHKHDARGRLASAGSWSIGAMQVAQAQATVLTVGAAAYGHTASEQPSKEAARIEADEAHAALRAQLASAHEVHSHLEVSAGQTIADLERQVCQTTHHKCNLAHVTRCGVLVYYTQSFKVEVVALCLQADRM